MVRGSFDVGVEGAAWRNVIETGRTGVCERPPHSCYGYFGELPARGGGAGAEGVVGIAADRARTVEEANAVEVEIGGVNVAKGRCAGQGSVGRGRKGAVDQWVGSVCAAAFLRVCWRSEGDRSEYEEDEERGK